MCDGTLDGMHDEGPPPAIVKLMGDVAELMLADLDDLVAEMDAAELELIPTLGADAAIWRTCRRATAPTRRACSSMFVRRDDRAAPIDVPPEALDVARTVARRGIDLDVIFQSYRRGQNVALRRFLAHATRVVPSGPPLVQLLGGLLAAHVRVRRPGDRLASSPPRNASARRCSVVRPRAAPKRSG